MKRALQFLGLPLVENLSEIEKHGYGLVRAVGQTVENGEKAWLLDSLSFLARNPAVVGIMCVDDKDKHVAARVVGKECTWCKSLGTVNKTAFDSIEECLSYKETFIVWKMWVPVQQALKHGPGDLYMHSTSLKETQRIEMERTSVYMPLLRNYEDQKKCISAQLAKFKSSVLLSDNESVVLVRPTRNGFRGEKLLSVDCLSQYRQAERVFETFVRTIQINAEMRPEDKCKVYNLAAHALHAACRSLAIGLKAADFSVFDDSELEYLRTYDKHLQANASRINDAERLLEQKAKVAENEMLEKISGRPPPPKPPPPVAAPPPGMGPRDPAALAAAREKRKKRLQRLARPTTPPTPT